jgi:hypothetical protein
LVGTVLSSQKWPRLSQPTQCQPFLESRLVPQRLPWVSAPCMYYYCIPSDINLFTRCSPRFASPLSLVAHLLVHRHPGPLLPRSLAMRLRVLPLFLTLHLLSRFDYHSFSTFNLNTEHLSHTTLRGLSPVGLSLSLSPFSFPTFY